MRRRSRARELLTFRALWSTWQAIDVVTQTDAFSSNRVREACELIAARTDIASGRYVALRIHEELDSHTLLELAPRRRSARVALALDADRAPEHAEAIARFRPGDVVAPARHQLAEMISLRLGGHVEPFVVTTPDGAFARFVPNCLLAGIYLLFAFAMTGRNARQRECENPRCPNGRLFIERRRDERYCNKQCRELARYYRTRGKGRKS